MKTKKRIRTISSMKKNPADLLSDVQNGALVITQKGEARAVIQSMEDFERQQDALLMLRLIAHGESEISAGKFVDQESAFAALQDELKEDAPE